MHNKYHEIFQTIPVLGNELTRDPDTLKKLVDGRPFKPTSWDISDKPAKILLADTGKSKIIAIDFDGPEGDKNFHTALNLDPSCKYIAKGIGKGGGHMLYKVGNTNILDKAIPGENGCNISGLDLQRGRKLILLATEGNKTKELMTEQIESYDELTEMPDVIQLLISNIYLQTQQAEAPAHQATNSSTHSDSKLYYIVDEALRKPDEYNARFFNIVTTREYKGIMEKNQKHLDYKYIPDNLPMDSSAQTYLTSIATILGRDPSIDHTTFEKAMNYVNSLFSAPKPQGELDGIVKYITSGNSKIKGEQVWGYNPDWNKTGLIYIDNNGSSHEVFMFTDKGNNSYLDHNHITNKLTEYKTIGALTDTIKATSKTSMNKEKVLNRILKVDVVSDPIRDFGIHRGEYGNEFNLYKWTEEQEILRNPDLHKDNYNRPNVTLKFLENSMGRDKLYDFFLPFMKRKFTNYTFSPLILVLYGPPHSGKSAIPEGILSPLINGRYINLGTEVATEKYNDWMLNKDVVFIDEIHHTRADILEKLVNVINRSPKKLTGIRAMNVSASSEAYDNRITYMAACNAVTALATETNDRRLVILRSRNTASDALEMSNSAIEKGLIRESKDFAYYLSTEVVPLEESLYTHNGWLKDNDYKEYMQGSLSFVKALSASIVNADFINFESTMLDKNISLEDIRRSTQIYEKTNQIQIRLLNSNEHEAYYPSLLNHGNVDVKKIVKELKEINSSNVMIRRDDRKDGVKASNKKTVAVFKFDILSKDFLELVESTSDYIEPIED